MIDRSIDRAFGRSVVVCSVDGRRRGGGRGSFELRSDGRAGGRSRVRVESSRWMGRTRTRTHQNARRRGASTSRDAVPDRESDRLIRGRWTAGGEDETDDGDARAFDSVDATTTRPRPRRDAIERCTTRCDDRDPSTRRANARASLRARSKSSMDGRRPPRDRARALASSVARPRRRANATTPRLARARRARVGPPGARREGGAREKRERERGRRARTTRADAGPRPRRRATRIFLCASRHPTAAARGDGRSRERERECVIWLIRSIAIVRRARRCASPPRARL